MKCRGAAICESEHDWPNHEPEHISGPMHRCTSCKLAHAPVRSLTGGHCCAGADTCANCCAGAARASSLQGGHPAQRLAVRSAQEKQIKKHYANGPALLAIGWPHLQVCQNLLAMCTGPQHLQGLGLATTTHFHFFCQKMALWPWQKIAN